MTDQERHAAIAAANDRARRDVRMARQLIGTMDAVAREASALPDVVKTPALKQALSNYRAKRNDVLHRLCLQ